MFFLCPRQLSYGLAGTRGPALSAGWSPTRGSKSPGWLLSATVRADATKAALAWWGCSFGVTFGLQNHAEEIPHCLGVLDTAVGPRRSTPSRSQKALGMGCVWGVDQVFCTDLYPHQGTWERTLNVPGNYRCSSYSPGWSVGHQNITNKCPKSSFASSQDFWVERSSMLTHLWLWWCYSRR